uniref:Uncharacterized protein n=1 Tax=Zea mays TaxID=4577 RepID=A0A804UGK1_MAIZE
MHKQYPNLHSGLWKTHPLILCSLYNVCYAQILPKYHGYINLNNLRSEDKLSKKKSQNHHDTGHRVSKSCQIFYWIESRSAKGMRFDVDVSSVLSSCTNTFPICTHSL